MGTDVCEIFNIYTIAVEKFNMHTIAIKNFSIAIVYILMYIVYIYKIKRRCSSKLLYSDCIYIVYRRHGSYVRDMTYLYYI